MNDFEWQAVRDYLTDHAEIAGNVVRAAKQNDAGEVVRLLRILLAPSCAACDTVEIEYRRK